MKPEVILTVEKKLFSQIIIFIIFKAFQNKMRSMLNWKTFQVKQTIVVFVVVENWKWRNYIAPEVSNKKRVDCFLKSQAYHKCWKKIVIRIHRRRIEIQWR